MRMMCLDKNEWNKVMVMLQMRKRSDDKDDEDNCERQEDKEAEMMIKERGKLMVMKIIVSWWRR